MDAQEVKNILVEALGEDQSLSMIPSSKCAFEEHSVISLKQYNDIVDGMESYFVDFMQSDQGGDNGKIEFLQKAIKKLRNLTKVRFQESDVQENGKSMLVCNSDVFSKDEKATSKWLPSCLVSLNVSWSKSFEIAPDIRADEPSHSVLNMVHKWRGMKGNSAPLVIPIDVKEMEHFLLGSLVMFSIFDSSRSKFPLVLNGPESCNQLLPTTENWTEMGQLILSSFDISAEKLGMVLKAHLQNIVKAQSVTQAEGAKLPKRKKPEENLMDVWAERKKSYFTNITKKSKNV